MLIGLCQYDYLRCWHGNRLELPSEFSFCLEVVLLFQSQIENSYFSPPKETVRSTVPSLFRNFWVMKRESGQVCPLLGGAISTFIKSVSYSWGVLLIHSLIILESSVVPDTLLQDRGPETWIWSLLLQSCVKWETAVFTQRISRRVLVVGTRGKSCEREVRSAQKVFNRAVLWGRRGHQVVCESWTRKLWGLTGQHRWALKWCGEDHSGKLGREGSRQRPDQQNELSGPVLRTLKNLYSHLISLAILKELLLLQGGELFWRTTLWSILSQFKFL